MHESTRSCRPGRRVAAAAALLGMIVSGCGVGDDAVSTTNGAGATSLPPSSIAAAEQLLDEIMDGMRGTDAQLEALMYLEHVTFQQMKAECMAAKGFIYVAPPAYRVASPSARIGDGVLDPVDPAAVEANGLGLNATVDGFVAAAKAGDPIIPAVSDPDLPRVPEHEVPGWIEASNGCMPADKDINARVAHPSYERGAPISDLVHDVLNGKTVQDAMAGYPECMSAAGWPVNAERDGGPRRDLVWTVRGGFEELLVNAASSFSRDSTQRARQVDQVVASADWRRLDEGRADAASADSACRQESHDLAFTALLEPLRNFKAKHHAEIEQLRAEWAAFEQRANQTPDPGRR